MRIVTLFDKSFLQSLSIDESVWFDMFFLGNICPIFYVETLADLHKPVKGRSPEEEVHIIAEKFPEMHGAPSAYHQDMYIHELLLGEKVPMDGRLPISHGVPVAAQGQIGMKFPESPEAEAFSRWQCGEFQRIEYDFAARWRNDLANLNLDELASQIVAIVRGRSCKSLEEAKMLARSLVSDNRNHYDQIGLFLNHLGVNRTFHNEITKRIQNLKFPELSQHVPYAAHVLTVNLFFRVALAEGLISKERPSNWVDIAYLFYVPFCQLFVSSDKLHRNCAPLFLRNDQEFLWGPDLKAGLHAMDEHYKNFPEEMKKEGVLRFARHPPMEGDFFVSRLWDRHLPKWRSVHGNAERYASDNEDSALIERIRGFNEGKVIEESRPGIMAKPDFLSLKRNVRRVKGSWYQVPDSVQ